MHGTLGSSGAARPEKLDVNLRDRRTSERVITEPRFSARRFISRSASFRACLSAARNLLGGEVTDGYEESRLARDPV